MTTPQPEHSTASTETPPSASPARPAPTVMMAVLHLDCPMREQVEGAVPPKFLLVEVRDDVVVLTCLGCGCPLGLQQVEVEVGDADLDGVPALHD